MYWHFFRTLIIYYNFRRVIQKVNWILTQQYYMRHLCVLKFVFNKRFHVGYQYDFVLSKTSLRICL